MKTLDLVTKGPDQPGQDAALVLAFTQFSGLLGREEAEPTRQVDEVSEFPQGAKRQVQEVNLLLQALPCGTLHDVGRHRDCRTPHLRSQPEKFPSWKAGCGPIDLDRQSICQLESLEFPVISHRKELYAH